MKQCPSINLDRGGLRSMLNWAKCGLFLASILAVHAGDPIKFSPSGDKVALPDKNTKENKLDGPIKGGSGESVGDYELPTSMPATPSSTVLFNNKKLQELIDQRKNWIFMTPEMTMGEGNGIFEKAKTSNEAAPDLFETGGKSKKVVERYIENKDHLNKPSIRVNTEKLEEELSSGKASKGMITGKMTKDNGSNNSDEGGAQIGTTEMGAEDALYRATELRGRGFGLKSSGFLDSATQRKMEADRRFQQLLHPAAPAAPSDPMQMMADETAKDMQPVTVKSLESLAGDKISTSGNPFGDPNQAAFPRRFGSINATISGSSSLSPAMIAPSPTVQLMSQPVVLPLPKRKF